LQYVRIKTGERPFAAGCDYEGIPPSSDGGGAMLDPLVELKDFGLGAVTRR